MEDDDRPVTQKEFKKLESQMATISRDLETFKTEIRAMFAEQRTGQVLTGPIVPTADLTGSEEDQVHNHHWTVVFLRKHKGCCFLALAETVLGTQFKTSYRLKITCNTKFLFHM